MKDQSPENLKKLKSLRPHIRYPKNALNTIRSGLMKKVKTARIHLWKAKEEANQCQWMQARTPIKYHPNAAPTVQKSSPKAGTPPSKRQPSGCGTPRTAQSARCNRETRVVFGNALVITAWCLPKTTDLKKKARAIHKAMAVVARY